MRDVNQETITGTLSWCKILPLSGFSLIRVKTKTSHETVGNLSKFLEPSHKPKVVHTDNALEFGKACGRSTMESPTSTPHRSETNGIAGRAVRRVKEGTSAVLLHSGLQNKNQKRDDKMNSDGLMADRLVWLDFKVNLKDKELHASAHSSRESLPEHPSKVATKSRKHSNGTHFPSDRNCNFWLNQNHKGFLKNTHRRSSTSCRKVQ